MSKRNRIPHTASFLQTFHTAGHGLPAYTGEAVAAAEERSAMQFVSGAQQAKAAERTERMQQSTIKVSGWSVLTGPGLVTEKQAKWMISIANRPSVTDAMRESLKVRLFQGFARQAASQFIDRYKGIPTAAAESAKIEAVAPGATEEEYRAAQAPKAEPMPIVEDGRYAVKEDGELKFFKVKNGRKPGFVFLDIQASDDWHSIRNVSRIRSILAEIAKDPKAAMARYGQEIGACGRCGRTLTSEYRQLGIGPICIDK